MTIYLLTCSFYQKVSRSNGFQYKICDRMSYLTALYDNFKIFRKKIQRGRDFENRGEVREISTDFQSKNGFELTKVRRIKFWAIALTPDTFFFFHYVPPLRNIIKNWTSSSSIRNINFISYWGCRSSVFFYLTFCLTQIFTGKKVHENLMKLFQQNNLKQIDMNFFSFN